MKKRKLRNRKKKMDKKTIAIDYWCLYYGYVVNLESSARRPKPSGRRHTPPVVVVVVVVMTVGVAVEVVNIQWAFVMQFDKVYINTEAILDIG